MRLLKESNEDFRKPEFIFDDSRKVDLRMMKFDAIVTSPPFTIQPDNTDSEFDFNSIESYESYVLKLVNIFERLGSNLKYGAKIIVEIGDDYFNNQPVEIKDMFKRGMEMCGFSFLEEISNPHHTISSYFVFQYGFEA